MAYTFVNAMTGAHISQYESEQPLTLGHLRTLVIEYAFDSWCPDLVLMFGGYTCAYRGSTEARSIEVPVDTELKVLIVKVSTE